MCSFPCDAIIERVFTDHTNSESIDLIQKEMYICQQIGKHSYKNMQS